MEIMVAKHAGFCFGVKKAIEIAEETAAKNDGKTYVYGQLVHNEQVIEDLQKKGIEFVENIDDIPENAVTVLRAHGEPGTTYEELKQKNIVKDGKLKGIQKTELYVKLLSLMEKGKIDLLEDESIFQSLKSVQFIYDTDKYGKRHLKIFGNDTHICEGITRCTELLKYKELTMVIYSIKV